jgi:hypothetical protein
MQIMLKKLLCLATVHVVLAGFTSLWSQPLFKAAGKSPVSETGEWLHAEEKSLLRFGHIN